MGNITYRVLLKLWRQQGVLLLLAAISLWWIDHTLSYSILIGGLIYLIPNMYFALHAFRFRGAQAAQYILLGFYRGEIGKFLLSCVGFAIVFTFVNPLNMLGLFIAYSCLTIIQWFQLAMIQKKNKV